VVIEPVADIIAALSTCESGQMDAGEL